ncbi:MAG: aspartate 1-decarboxylase [Dehalococcoidales bacterium]|nr:MAG: aspartate 1-decarboxylase [Dehalococcoidales bacterium]
MRVMIKSKIHRARVTDTDIDYEGSITIDRSLMEAADIVAYEQVHVLNINNGARFTTYALEGEKGEICLNGAAARLVVKGDIVLVFAYGHIEDEQLVSFSPKLVYVDDKNNIIKTK